MARSKNEIAWSGYCDHFWSYRRGFCRRRSKFDGWLDMGMGNLPLLSNAKTRSIGPENPTGEKGKGGMAKLGEGSASNAAARLRTGLEGKSVCSYQAEPDVCAGRHKRQRRNPAYLDDARRKRPPEYIANLLGRRRNAFGGMPLRRLFCLRPRRVRAGYFAGRLRQSEERL